MINLLYYLYLLTIPFGRVPMATPFGSLTTDDLIAVLLFLCLLFYRLINIRQSRYFDKRILFSFSAFFLWGFITILFSEDPMLSLDGYMSHFVFAGITLLLLFPQKQETIGNEQCSIFATTQQSSKFIYTVTILVSVLILSLHFGKSERFWFHSYSHIFPFNILFPRVVNANDTGVGITLGALLGLLNVNITQRSTLKNILYLLSFVLPFAVVALVQTRTAIIAVTISGLIVLLKHIRRIPVKKIKSLSKLLFLLPVFIIVFLSSPQLLDRFLLLASSSISQEPRLALYSRSISNIFLSAKNFLIGRGFMISDPHNEFLRHWEGSGIIGALLFLNIFIAVYKYAFRSRDINKKTLVAEQLFFFVVIAILVLPLTKMLWVSLFFVMLARVEDQAIIVQPSINVFKRKRVNTDG